MYTIPRVGVGKERPTKKSPRLYLKRQHPWLELPWELLALRRRTLGSERHRYEVALPEEVGTDLMAVHDRDGRRRRKREGGEG